MSEEKNVELTPEEIEEMERMGEEESYNNWLMQKAEDAMWRNATSNLVKNGIKPLISF
jgi:hypothetical protein